VLLAGGVFDRHALWSAGALAATYAACLTGVSMRLAASVGWRHLPRFLVVFPILHFAYGLGSLVGLVRFLPRWWIREASPPALQSRPLER